MAQQINDNLIIFFRKKLPRHQRHYDQWPVISSGIRVFASHEFQLTLNNQPHLSSPHRSLLRSLRFSRSQWTEGPRCTQRNRRRRDGRGPCWIFIYLLCKLESSTFRKPKKCLISASDTRVEKNILRGPHFLIDLGESNSRCFGIELSSDLSLSAKSRLMKLEVLKINNFIFRNSTDGSDRELHIVLFSVHHLMSFKTKEGLKITTMSIRVLGLRYPSPRSIANWLTEISIPFILFRAANEDIIMPRMRSLWGISFVWTYWI